VTSDPPASPPLIVQYLDVVLVVAAAPILLLMGVSAVGYGAGAGAWLILRAVGVGVDRVAETSDARAQVSLRLGYMLGRLFVLALVVVLARRNGGQDAGLAALLVVVIAFTVQLLVSALNRPRKAGKGTGAR
jgi:hypothetical protein